MFQYLQKQARLESSMGLFAALVRQELRDLDIQTRTLQRPSKRARPLCGARCRDAHPCQARAVAGGIRCRMHGGGDQDTLFIQRFLIAHQRRELLCYLRVALALAG